MFTARSLFSVESGIRLADDQYVRASIILLTSFIKIIIFLHVGACVHGCTIWDTRFVRV